MLPHSSPSERLEADERARNLALEFARYVGRIRQFQRQDWLLYTGWVGLMLGLVAVTAAFLLIGRATGVQFPAEAWLVPMGAALFSLSIAIDTIGHRTIYKSQIQKAEGLVHGITIFCGIGSCVLLCLAYSRPALFWIPALTLTILSFVYSLVDEAFHWHRYVNQASDRVEMWSHLGILAGHSCMMLGWWTWFFKGYPGVAATLERISAL